MSLVCDFTILNSTTSTPYTTSTVAINAQAGNTFVFSDSSSWVGTGVFWTWYWDFGDGSTSTIQNPTHVFKTPGTYTVSLTITTTTGIIATKSSGSFTITSAALTTSNFNPTAAPFLTLRDSVFPPQPAQTIAKKKTLTNLEIDANFTALAGAIQNIAPSGPTVNPVLMVSGRMYSALNGAEIYANNSFNTTYTSSNFYVPNLDTPGDFTYNNHLRLDDPSGPLRSLRFVDVNDVLVTAPGGAQFTATRPTFVLEQPGLYNIDVHVIFEFRFGIAVGAPITINVGTRLEPIAISYDSYSNTFTQNIRPNYWFENAPWGAADMPFQTEQFMYVDPLNTVNDSSLGSISVNSSYKMWNGSIPQTGGLSVDTGQKYYTLMTKCVIPQNELNLVGYYMRFNVTITKISDALPTMIQPAGGGY